MYVMCTIVKSYWKCAIAINVPQDYRIDQWRCSFLKSVIEQKGEAFPFWLKLASFPELTEASNTSWTYRIGEVKSVDKYKKIILRMYILS